MCYESEFAKVLIHIFYVTGSLQSRKPLIILVTNIAGDISSSCSIITHLLLHLRGLSSLHATKVILI